MDFFEIKNGILYTVKIDEMQTTLNTPDEVSGIWFDAFSGCMKVESIKLNDGLSYIKGGAFLECTSLKDIYIPPSVSKIHVFDENYLFNCQAAGCKGGYSEFRNASITFKVIGYPNTLAEKYCEHFNIPFQNIDK